MSSPSMKIEAADPAVTGDMGLTAFLRAASDQLKLAHTKGSIRASSLRDLPVVLLIGPHGAGKSTTLAKSQLLPELLVIQTCSGGTGVWSLWLAGGTVFLEAPDSATADTNTLRMLGRQLRPNVWAILTGRPQPPRSILFLAPHSLVGPQPDAKLVEAARVWHFRIQTLGEALACEAPLYVVVTKLEEVEGFSEFASVLGDAEVARPVGSTLPSFDPEKDGEYGDWLGRMVPDSFTQIVHSLRDGRVPAMLREQNAGRLAYLYEFAKRFERLQHNFSLFLRELTMVKQPAAGPFLRGYYFSGMRTVERRGEVFPSALEHAPDATMTITATAVLERRQSGPGTTARILQQQAREWLFLPALLREVVLADQAVRPMSGSGSQSDSIRAGAIAAVAAAGLLLLLLLTVSYGRNRGLERQLESGGAIVRGNTPANAAQRLEAMRPAVDRLLEFREHAPWSMRWGLDQTGRLVGPAQRLYCTAVREQVVDPLRKQMETRLLSAKNGQGNAVEDYRLLKAYLMMTTRPAQADAGFLSSTLLEMANPADRTALLGKQLETYGKLLPVPDAQAACVFTPQPGLISSSQGYLRGLSTQDRYQALLQLAAGGLQAVDYNTRFANEAVRDAHVVPAAFTREAWARMQDLLRHPEQWLRIEGWVLGRQDEPALDEWKVLANQLGERYRADYVRQWEDFLAAGQVAQYASLRDAAAKLEAMSGQRSVLLRLVGLASENTSFDPVKPVFQPAQHVVAANGDIQAATYLEQLDILKNRLLRASDSSGAAYEQDAREVRGAITATQDAVDRIAIDFRGDSDQVVKAILLRPVASIGSLLNEHSLQAVTRASRDFCRDVETVTRRFPFSHSQQSARLDRVQDLLQPPDGRIWKFYNEVLGDSLVCEDTGCLTKEAPQYPVSKRFERYFTSLYNWSRLLFGSGGDAVVHLYLRALKDNYLQKLDVTLDGATVSLAADSTQRATLAWDLQRAGGLQVTGTFEGESVPQKLFQSDGVWKVFEWVAAAETGSGGAGGFHWIPRTGTTRPVQLENRHTAEYRVLIQWADGSGRALDLRNLTLGACVLPLAR